MVCARPSKAAVRWYSTCRPTRPISNPSNRPGQNSSNCCAESRPAPLSTLSPLCPKLSQPLPSTTREPSFVTAATEYSNYENALMSPVFRPNRLFPADGHAPNQLLGLSLDYGLILFIIIDLQGCPRTHNPLVGVQIPPGPPALLRIFHSAFAV